MGLGLDVGLSPVLSLGMGCVRDLRFSRCRGAASLPRTGRRVISQGWGFFGKGPLGVSVLVGWWAGGGGLDGVGGQVVESRYSTYRVRTSARPFLPFHCYPLATVLPPPPLCRSATVQCPQRPQAAQGPAIVASQTCSSRGEASGRVTSVISIQE